MEEESERRAADLAGVAYRAHFRHPRVRPFHDTRIDQVFVRRGVHYAGMG